MRTLLIFSSLPHETWLPLRVSLSRSIMVRFCAFPNCPNKMTSWTTMTFHRLPFANLEILKLWLVALKMDPDTDMEGLKRADHRVCSAHFTEQDFFPRPENPKYRKTERQRRRLRVTAIPAAEDTTNPLEVMSFAFIMFY